MSNMTTMRMLLSTAALAAFAVVFAGSANAKMLDEGGSGGGAPTVKAIEHRAFGSGLIGDPAIRKAIENRAFGSGLIGDSALTRSSAPQTLWRSSAPQALTRSSAPQFRGAHRGQRPGTVTLPTASSASDGVDWSWLGLGAGMTALLAAGIAGVVLTTRRRGGIALP